MGLRLTSAILWVTVSTVVHYFKCFYQMGLKVLLQWLIRWCLSFTEPYDAVCCVQRGETALHMAARAGQVEVVRCLLRNGAMVDARARVSLMLRTCEMGNLPSFTDKSSHGLRRTRLPSTLPPVWEKRRLSSCFCSTWPIPMLPRPTATPHSTYRRERGRWRRPLCC